MIRPVSPTNEEHSSPNCFDLFLESPTCTHTQHTRPPVIPPCLWFRYTDFQTAAPDHNGVTENTAIIAGVVAALVLLVALTLLAVYYINTHPTAAPPFDLMQVNDNSSRVAQLPTIILSANSYLTDSWPFSNNCRLLTATHQ